MAKGIPERRLIPFDERIPERGVLVSEMGFRTLFFEIVENRCPDGMRPKEKGVVVTEERYMGGGGGYPYSTFRLKEDPTMDDLQILDRALREEPYKNKDNWLRF